MLQSDFLANSDSGSDSILVAVAHLRLHLTDVLCYYVHTLTLHLQKQIATPFLILGSVPSCNL